MVSKFSYDNILSKFFAIGVVATLFACLKYIKYIDHWKNGDTDCITFLWVKRCTCIHIVIVRNIMLKDHYFDGDD